MSKKLQLFRKVSLLLGIVTLMLGLLPLASLSGGVIFADDSAPAPENGEGETKQEAPPPAAPPENNESGEQDEEEVEEPQVPQEPEEVEGPEGVEELDEVGEVEEVEEPDEVEEPEVLEETEEEFMLFSLSSSTGPTDEDPDDLGLPELGPSGFYGSECEKPENAGICEKNEDGNEVKDGGTFTPSIGSPNVVVIKAGPNEYIFSPNGPDCNLTTGGDPYCVTFGDNGEVTVEVNQCFELVGAKQNCKPANDISNIQFWKPGDECECEGVGLLAVNGGCECPDPDDDIYGCTDREAVNFNPDATVDDQSCEYEDPEDPEDPGDPGGGGGGGGTTSLSVPPAGTDPVLIPVTGVNQLAELQLVLRSLGMAFVGASVLSGGLQRKIRR